MNKENILFSVIGVLLGFIIGFFFANTVNQRGLAPTAQVRPGASQPLPSDHPPVASNAVADPQGMQAAVQDAIKKARSEPNNFEAQVEAAQLFYQINRYDDAIEFLTRANQARPDDYETMVRLGDANFDATHYDVARRWYTAALARKPDDVNVRTDLGLSYMFNEPPDYDRAISEFRTSLQRDPKHEQTLQNLVVALTRKGDIKEAQATLDRLKTANPQNPAISRLASDLDKARGSSSDASKASK